MGGITINLNLEKHNFEVINNDSEFVHYDGMVYFMSEHTQNEKKYYELVSLPIDADNTKSLQRLIDFGTISPGKNLKIDNGKVFYFYAGNTYDYDINQKSVHKFCEGTLQYINSTSDYYITLYNGELYGGTYYSSTGNTKEIHHLITSKVVKLGEDENYLYYYVPLDKSVLIGLRKSDLTVVVFDTILKEEFSLLKAKIEEKEIVELLKKDEEYFTANIDKKTRQKGKIEMISETEAQTLLKQLIDQYHVKLADGKVFLYQEDKEITSISYSIENAESVSLENLEIVDNYLYFDVLVKTTTLENDSPKEERILARTPKDGGISFQLNS